MVSILDIIGKPSVHTSLEYTTNKYYNPISSMIESGSLEFTKTGSGDQYLDLISLDPIYTCQRVSLTEESQPQHEIKQFQSTTGF